MWGNSLLCAKPRFVIETHALTKQFAGFRAVSEVSFRVDEGAIHAIIGPNGAGKTTLFNLLSGFIAPTGGTVHFDGSDVTHIGPAAIARRGMVRSFQINSIFPHLTVLDNVKISLQAKTGLSRQLVAPAKATAVLDDPALAILARLGLESYAAQPAAELSYGRKRALELAIALAQDPKVLLLDEPTAGMAIDDVERVVELVREVAVGRTIVLVEHNLRVVADLCTKITVMQRGQILIEGTYDEVRSDKRVVDAYLGGGH
jgi:branched-chain amino acid transport system ATP-binding protein